MDTVNCAMTTYIEISMYPNARIENGITLAQVASLSVQVKCTTMSNEYQTFWLLVGKYA